MQIISLKKLDLNAQSRQTPQNRLFETRLVRFARMQARPGSANVEAHLLNKNLIKLCSSSINFIVEPMLREFAFPQSAHWPKLAPRQQQPGIRIDCPGSRNKTNNDRASANSRRRGVVRGLCGHFTGRMSLIRPQCHFRTTQISTCLSPLPLLGGAGMPSRDGGSTASRDGPGPSEDCRMSRIYWFS